jgi:hypothetical protein
MITNEILRSLAIRRVASRRGTSGPSVARKACHTDVDDFQRWQFDGEKRKERTKEEIGALKEIADPDLSTMIAEG